jgi:hypothetical protein
MGNAPSPIVAVCVLCGRGYSHLQAATVACPLPPREAPPGRTRRCNGRLVRLREPAPRESTEPRDYRYLLDLQGLT